MRRVRIEDVESIVGAPDVKRPIGAAVGATNLAINHYGIGPGESMSFGFHAHADQEEVYYVERGSLTFETEDGETLATAGDVVRSPPGEYKQGVNRGDERATVLAIGAPAGMGETDIRRACPECGERTSQTIEVVGGGDLSPAELQAGGAGQAVVLRCLDCGVETGRFE